MVGMSISGWIATAARIFEVRASAAILVGSSITIREADEPAEWMELARIKHLLSSGIAVIRRHINATHFRNYSISPGYVCDLDNAGMVLQRLEKSTCTEDGLFADIDGVSEHIKNLSGNVWQKNMEPQWLNTTSSRVYAFGIIDGFDSFELDSLMSNSLAKDGDLLSGFDFKTLATLLNCRPLACELEKCGFDIGMEVYLVFRSGNWLYFGYDEIYQEGLVICENESGFNPSASKLLDRLTSS